MGSHQYYNKITLNETRIFEDLLYSGTCMEELSGPYVENCLSKGRQRHGELWTGS